MSDFVLLVNAKNIKLEQDFYVGKDVQFTIFIVLISLVELKQDL